MKHWFSKTPLARSVQGAAMVALCGLAIWKMPVGEAWANASYDYLFRFSTRAVTNEVVFIAMDNDAYDQFQQVRGQPWDRELHARLLDKLSQDGCALVVFDTFFRKNQDPVTDEKLAAAMRRQRAVVLMAEQAEVSHTLLHGARPTLPTEPFLSAAGNNWGVAWIAPDADSIVRRHWPDPSPGPYPSLPETAARLAGASPGEAAQERWLRYYHRDGNWTTLSYGFALTKPQDYFRDKIVFIGARPKALARDAEAEEFRTPFTRWTNESTSGAEIMMTSFLNLRNRDWLRRPAWWLEALVLGLGGGLLGGLMCRLKIRAAIVASGAVFCLAALAGIFLSHFTQYWFPWLVISAAQAPVALGWAVATRQTNKVPVAVTDPVTVLTPAVSGGAVAMRTGNGADLPDTPDYELVNPPFGRGAYGKVWLARNAVGQWQALKAVYLSNFDNDPGPYDREFNGISRYKPISDKHPGLLKVEFVSRKRADHFYYVMELGDPLQPGWEADPATYKPRDLVSARARTQGRRLPVAECLELGLVLTDALEFLHRQGLTHRDIKPQNIVFVNGQPKLADVGLIGRIPSPGQEATSVGTPGYMPPRTEALGTPQADIYSLGMVLYVLSTGSAPAHFPEIATTLVSRDGDDFFPLNAVILKACNPDCTERYTSAAEMHQALGDVKRRFEAETAVARGGVV